MDLSRLIGAFRAAAWGWLVPSALLIVLSLLIRAQRWRILLNHRLSLSDAFWLTNIGYLVNNLLPLRLGEAAKAVVAGWRGSLSPFAVLSTVVIERVLDLLTVVLLMLLTLPFIVHADLGEYVSWGWVSGGLGLGAIAGLALLARFPALAERPTAWLLARLRFPRPERLLNPLHQLLEGLAPLRSLRQGGQIAFWSLLNWASVALYFQTALYAFTPTPSAIAGPVATWAAALGMLLPAPGGIGTYHTAVIQALTLAFDFAPETAGAYAFVTHALAYVIDVSLGAGALLAWGLSFKQVIDGAQALETAPAPIENPHKGT